MAKREATHARPAHPPLTTADYETLAAFRHALRQFLDFSEHQARAAGLTPRQHQALLQIKGTPPDAAFTVGDLAARLLIRHHSAVELADRLAEAGLIERSQDSTDRRRVNLRLTAAAEDRLHALSAIHLEELHRLRPALTALLGRLPPDGAG
ncbi:MAG TPA: helix-turn-helix domain-containing protein [Acetobacteraceae bacterium]|nr:helix-turn-helix domain-containing protein [Acetobacteraceae bacterium]